MFDWPHGSWLGGWVFYFHAWSAGFITVQVFETFLKNI
jgi:hypothetical protein